MPEAVRELSDEQRADLKGQLTRKSSNLSSRSLGYRIRGQEQLSDAPVAKIPSTLDGAELSVCGVKGFMVDHVREFTDANGKPRVIDCAHVAALEITDSPVHVHGVTDEIYTILSGKGKMVLNNEIHEVTAGNVIVLPPGVEHGVVSDDPQVPVKVLLTFTPGLAPKSEPDFRDEQILYDRTSDRITQLQQGTHDAIASV